MIRRFFLTLYFVIVPTFCIAEVNQIARHEQQGFAQKVDTYVNAVKNRCEGNAEITALLAKSMQLQADSYMRTVASQVSLIGPQLIRNKTDDEREMCCAALLKMVMPIVEQFNQEMFKNLHEIDRCLEYWEYQRVHPVYYFSHKSPIKHFTLGQSEEIREKIRFLKEEQQYQYALLGKINIHLSTFDVHSSVSEKYEWVHQGCSILFSYDTGLIVSKHAELFPLLSEAIHVVHGYHKYMMKRLYKYYIPNVLVRKWLYVAGAAAGLGFGASYANKHQKDLVTNASGVQEFCKDTYADQLSNYRDTFFAHPEEETFLLNKYSEVITGLKNLPQEKKDLADFWRHIPDVDLDNPDEISPELAKRIRRDREYLADFWKKVDSADIAKIIKVDPAFEKRMSRYVLVIFPELMAKIGEYMQEATKKIKEGGGVILDGAQASTEELDKNTGLTNLPGVIDGARRCLGKATTEARVGWGAIEEGLDEFAKISGMVKEDVKLVSDTLSLKCQLLEKNSRFGRAVLFSMPYVGVFSSVGLGAYMLYKKIRGVPNYDSVRAALIDIALLLNVYGDAQPEDMDPCDFGKLSYLVYKLQFEEGRVPKQYRSSFLTEVALLKTARLTADQKMKTIELLFKKYPFLASQGTVVT